MSYYTLHFVSPTMGYFERTVAFDAINDEVAASIAGRQAGPQELELWNGGRLVRRFPADPAFAFDAKPGQPDLVPGTRTIAG